MYACLHAYICCVLSILEVLTMMCVLLVCIVWVLYLCLLVSVWLCKLTIYMRICSQLFARPHIPTPTYHYGRVSDSVFRYDHAVAVLVPLWRLVLHVGNGDGQLHWAAPVPTVRSNNFPGDVSPLCPHRWREERREEKMAWWCALMGLISVTQW